MRRDASRRWQAQTTGRTAENGQGRRNRPGNHQLGGQRVGGGRARRDPERRGWAHHPVGRGLLQDRRGARRRGGQAPGHHQPRPDHPLGEAPHGDVVDRRHRRQGVHGPGDLGPHPGQAQEGRRGVPRRHRDPGRHHRARVLRRRAAHGHQGGRGDRRARGAPHHQRADGRRAGLRPRQGGHRPHRPRLRPRRRDVRRLGARDRRGRLRGEVDLGQHQARRRRLGRQGHRVAGDRVQEHRGRRPVPGQDGHAAPEGGGREGQDRAVDRAGHPDQPALHHRDVRGAEAPRPEADAGQVQRADRRPGRRPAWRRSRPPSRTPA